MKNIIKKLVIYSMVGILQIGLGASVIEASPRHDDRDHQRYEQEMRRHDHESEREWHERQEQEKQGHVNTSSEIEVGLLGVIVGLMIDD